MAEEIIVDVGAGRVRGRIVDGVASFKGIPYGEAVSGRKRWQRSSPVTPWKGVRDAIAYGPRAIQPECRDMNVTSAELNDLMEAGMPADDGRRAQSEECLTLSVWTPEPGAQRKRPVMFWCHGGKYFGEIPPVWWFDGENLARNGDVVVVTVRHRVGVLGFLHLADLPGGSAYPDAANIGMLDLVAALQWVRENITSFGGDPGNVTIFGESGGGLKVSVLLAMPQAAGLFHKAIVQSGAQLQAQTRAEGTERTLALLTELEMEPGDVDALFDVAPERLAHAQMRMTPNRFADRGAKLVEFEPVVDGTTLPAHPFDPHAPEASRGVPVMVGTCATEMSFFFAAIPGVFALSDERLRQMAAGMIGAESDRLIGAYRARMPDATPTDLLFAIASDALFGQKATQLAERKVAQHGAAVYKYVLAFETDVHGGKFRTPHTLDIPLVFAHPDHPFLGSDPARFAVSRQMSGAWAAFAHTGNPSHDLLPLWPAFDTESHATMYFHEHPRLEAHA